MPELLRGHGSLRLTYLRGVSRSDAHRIQRALSPAKVLLPLGLGVAVAWWLLDSSWDDPVRDPASGLETTTRALLAQFTWSARASWALLGALACVLVRDLACFGAAGPGVRVHHG